MAKVAGPPSIVLASGSPIRRELLARAGLAVIVDPADIDEPAVAARFAASRPAERAKALAEAKARAISERRPGALVIGADQMLELEDVVLSKAPDRAAARTALTRMRGKSHQLHSGVALAREGAIVWSHVQSSRLIVREFSENWLESYMATAGEALTKSAGAYQLEGLGVQLFDKIEGDYFAILGLPLLALLAELRRLGAVGA